MGRQYFTTLYTLAKNRYSVILYTLINSRANRFVFIDMLCAINIAKFFRVKAKPFLYLIPVRSYNKQLGKPILYVLQLHLSVNRRCFFNIFLLILDFRIYNVIFSCKWLAYFNILLDYR
jgi:hypothetical protein